MSDPLPPGVYSMTAVEIDATGGVSAPSAPLSLTVSAVAAPAGLALSPTGGNITSAASPVITGTGQAGDTVELFSPPYGDPLAVGVVAGNGTWSLTSDSLPPGVYSFTAVETNAGNPSGPSAPFSLTVSAVPAPAGLMLSPSGGNSTSTTDPVITGTGQAGDTVELFSPPYGDPLAQGVVAGNGTWSLTSDPLPLGTYSITAVESNAGNPSGPSAPLSLTIHM
jgi:hypothetical protein